MLKKERKIKVELNESIVLELIKLKTKIGDTYSDIIGELLKKGRANK